MDFFLRRSVFALFLAVLLARVAGAVCQCPTLTPDEEKDQATYVFVGTVYDLKTPKGSDHTTVIFDVDDVFKGEPHSQVEVVDTDAGTDCALSFKENDPYTVYGHWDWGTITVSSCTGTTPMPNLGQVRTLGASDELKEKMYKELWENCLGKLTTRCCLSSISAMRKHYFEPEPEAGCPDGTIPDRLKCAGSERWCIPMTGDDPDRRQSAPPDATKTAPKTSVGSLGIEEYNEKSGGRMKAIAMFPGTHEIKIVEHPEPSVVRPTDVKVRMLQVGVCGTDREIWEFKYGEPPAGSDYLITGHESFGQVAAIGAAVTSVAVGDYVVLTVRRGCPENCISCANGQPDFCFTGHFSERGIKQIHGYMTEFVVDDEKYLDRVPAVLKDVAVLLEPLTIAEKALIEIYHIQSRLHWECRLDPSRKTQTCHTALVLGSGPVGLLGAMVLRALNMDVHVVARAKDPGPKEKVIKDIGARYHSTSLQTPAQIAQEIGNIDVIFEATGAASVSFDFLPVLGINGIFIFTGVPAPMKDLTIDAGTLMRNIVLTNQVILGTVNAPKIAFENGLRHLEEFQKKWPQALQSLITARLPFERFQETIRRDSPDDIKTILQIAPDR